MHACLLSFATLWAAAGDDQVALKEINVKLPANVSGIQFKGRQDFPEKNLGYSVSYGNTMCIVTLYVYDFDLKKIPDGKDSDQVKDQLRRTLGDIRAFEKQGVYKNVQEMKELPLPKEALERFAHAGLTFDVKGGGCKSYALLTARNNQFLKVRITQYVVDNNTNDADINAFVTALADQFKPAKQEQKDAKDKKLKAKLSKSEKTP